MKASFKELFSEFEDDMISIPEDEFFNNMDINKETVIKKALEKTGCTKNRKSFIRVMKMSLAAAVFAAILCISSTIIYANGGFQIAFEEFFGGNLNCDGLYDGGEVEIKSSDPNLDVSFLGVAGDECEMYAVIKAVKKDGGTFTDEGYVNPYSAYKSDEEKSYLESQKGQGGVVPDKLMSDIAGFDSITAIVKDRNGNNFGYSNDGKATIDSKYYLSDDRKTIKLLIHLDTNSASGTKHLDPRNGTATIISTSFIAQKNIRTIMTDDHLNEEVWNRFIKKCKELKISEFDCTKLYTNDKVIFCQVETKEYELPFEVTFKMNYRYNGNIKRQLNVSDAPHYIKPDTKNVKMTISSFSIRISGESEYVNDMNCFEKIDIDNSKVVMKDGTVYYFEYRGGAGGGGPLTGKVNDSCMLVYQEKPNFTLETEKILLDTREIKQVIINGDIVYNTELW